MKQRVTKKVAKALTPEEQTLVANIKSLLAELEGMQVADQEVQMAGQPPQAPQQAMKANPGEEEDIVGDEYDYDEDDVEKAIENASDSDEHDANDDAEDRLEDIPDVDEDNVREVAKVLAGMLARKSSVKKSINGASDGVVTALSEVVKVVKGMQDRVERQDSVMSEILEGLGVATSVTKQTKVAKAKPVQSDDVEAFRKVLKELIADNGDTDGTPKVLPNMGRSEVRKGMGSLLEALGTNGPWSQE